MSAPRVLLAWEHGGGLGHLTTLARLSRDLLAAGAEVFLASRVVTGVGAWLPPEVRLLPGPFTPEVPGAGPAPSFAGVLRTVGWADASRLGPTVRAWRGLVDVVAPDVVVQDSAPGLLLALRGSGVPVLSFQNPWGQPPDEAPCPALRWWEPPPPEAVLREIEQEVVGVANAVRPAGSAPLERLADVWRGTRALVFGVPESDPWAGRRGDERHVGPVLLDDEGTVPEWPAGRGLRVFVYLKREFPLHARVLDTLQRSGHPTVAYVSGLPAADRGTLRIVDRPVHLGRARDRVDLAITHSVLGTGFAFLLGAVPVMLLPMQLEQELTGRAATRLGGVMMVPPETVERAIGSALALALEPQFRLEAAATRRYLAEWREPFAAVTAEVLAAGRR